MARMNLYTGRPMTDPIAAALARILADPDDAGAWEVYAAWLLTQGDPRAELFALDSLADTPAEHEWTAAQIAKSRASWTPWFLSSRDCEWRHGFVVAATMSIGGRSDARRLADALTDPRCRLLGRLQLVLEPTTPARGLSPLAAADLGQLRSLRAAYHTRGNRIVRALVHQPTLNLRTLDLRHAGVTDDGLLALAGCEQLRGLRALYLQHNRCTARGVSALARSPALAQLEVLDLRYNPIGTAGAAALADSPYLGGLTALYLHAGELDPAGVRALGSSTTLPRDLVRYWRAQEAPR